MENVVTYPDISDFFIASVRHFVNAFFLGLIPPLVFSVLAWVVAGYYRTNGVTKENEESHDIRLTRKLHMEERLFVAAFAALGTLIGVFMGASRVGVVGTILPAVITLVSGYLAYLFSIDSKIINRQIVPVCLLALMFSASAGAFYGASVRNLDRLNERNWEKHLIKFNEIQIPLNKKMLEQQLNDMSTETRCLVPDYD